MIVVDLGCATYPEFPEDESVNRLIERFQPWVLYGFDPNPATQESRSHQGTTLVAIEQKAAWLYDGHIGYVQPPEVMNPLRCYTGEQESPLGVPCFDLSRFLRHKIPRDEIVLKMDVEGAEYTLLPYLHAEGVDGLLSLLLVEWHREPLEMPFRCPVEEW